MSRRAPTPEQSEAIRTRVRRILLEAGAGTGKTTVLVDRYCDRIEFDGLRPEEILAFTFTEKAAAEMGERIRAELGRRARESGDPELARRLREAAHRLSGAWVMTIHAFCRRVLAAHPVAAGLDPELTVFDQATTTRLEREAFDLALRDLLEEAEEKGPSAGGDEGGGAVAGAADFAAAYGIMRLRDLTLNAYRQLRSYGQLHPELPECPDADPASALARLERAAQVMFESDFRKHGPTDDKIRRAQEIAADRDRRLAGGPESELYAKTLAELEQLGHNSSVEVKAAVERARQEAVCALVAARYGPAAYACAARLVRLFDERFTALKQARSGIDYDDMQLRAVDLLQRDGAVRESYRGRFREVMVDEFQDTSAAQVALISALCGPETTLFEVGDEFQSIYRFRDADLENFRAERRRLAEDPDGVVLPLRGNFRSRASILATANAFTSALIPGFRPLTVGSEAQAAGPEGTGSAAGDGPGGTAGGGEGRGAGTAGAEVELIVTEPEGWEEGLVWPAPPPGTTSTRGAEAAAVARRLAELAESGVPRGDMVVLLRAHGTATAYVSALEQMGLAPFVVGGRGFWLGREVADATALLRTVANPLDEEGLFGALASPACAASPDALWLLRRAAGPHGEIWPLIAELAGDADPLAGDGESLSGGGENHGEGEGTAVRKSSEEAARWLEQIGRDDRERLCRFYRSVEELRRLQGLVGLAELVEEAVTRTGLDIATLSSRNGDLRWAGLRKLIRIAGEYEAAEGRDLRGLLEHGELAREVNDDGEAVVAAEGHDGVRLMTIHAAKGLEFPVVVVPELGRDPSGNSGRTAPDLRVAPDRRGGFRVGMKLRRVGANPLPAFEYDELAGNEKEACVEEEMRLFYVAMTRAKQRLILSGVGPKGPIEEVKPNTPILHRLLDHFDSSGGRITVPPPEPREGLAARFDEVEIPVHRNAPDEGAGADEAGGVTAAPERLFEVEGDQGQLFGSGEEAGAEDETGRDTGGTGDGTATGTRRVVDPPVEPVATLPALPALSFSALAEFESDPEGFVEELVSGRRFLDAAEDERAEDHQRDDELRETEYAARLVPHPEDDLPEGANLATAFGSAVHELLEGALRASGRRRWERPSAARIESALAGQGLAPTAERAAAAADLVDAWIGSEFCGEISSAPTTRLRAEVPLTLVIDPADTGDSPTSHGHGAAGSALDAVIHGYIDLLAEPVRDIPWVIDFKTNHLAGRAPDILVEKYRLQADIYALAVARALPNTGKTGGAGSGEQDGGRGSSAGADALPATEPVVEVVFVFLEAPEAPVRLPYTPDDLAEAERGLTGRIAKLRQRLAARTQTAVPPPPPGRSPAPETPLRDAQGPRQAHPSAAP